MTASATLNMDRYQSYKEMHNDPNDFKKLSETSWQFQRYCMTDVVTLREEPKEKDGKKMKIYEMHDRVRHVFRMAKPYNENAPGSINNFVLEERAHIVQGSVLTWLVIHSNS